MFKSTEEKKQYLANIIHMARADGKFTNDETNTIELIQKSIGAKKAELNQAYQLSENPEFQIRLVGHFSDKIKNLEDIILVSLIDGNIDESEKSILLDVARKIQITQDQFQLIINDVKNVISAKATISECSKCNAKTPANAKFCQECGNSISETVVSQSVPVAYEIPTTGITIEFAESTSAGFGDAVKDQKAAPLNGICIKAKKTWYYASWETKDISKSLKLVSNLKGMRNRKVYVDGKESKWDEIFGFTWCAEQRNSAYKPIEYCFGLDEKRLNIFGCKQTRMDWNEWSNWLSYGKFEKVGLLKNQVKFVFDKEQIEHEIKTNIFKCRYCPHINFNLIESVMSTLPEEATPTDNGPWQYKRDYNESAGSIKVKIKTVDDGYTYTDEFYSAGVSPKSISLGLDILRSAIETIDIDKVEIKGILDYNG